MYVTTLTALLRFVNSPKEVMFEAAGVRECSAVPE